MSRLKKQNGFTLVEMLIVVAIIAILIAISIPLVGSALENARENTDAANERAFKAALLTSYLQSQAGMNAPGEIEVEFGKPYCYDAVNGKICASADGITPYGKDRAGAGANKQHDHRGKYLWGHVGYSRTLKDPYTGVETTSTDNSVYMGWSDDKNCTVNKIDFFSLTSTWLQLEGASTDP